MSFLKTKGQHQMNKAQAAMNATKAMMMNANGGNEEDGLMPPMLPFSNRMIIPYYKAITPEDKHTTLEFDSVFESGNLALAVKVSNTEYNCLLQNDINTNGHTQWFYFKVKGTFKKKTSIKFNLINLYKHKSLYQYGMKVLTLDVSAKAAAKESAAGAEQDSPRKKGHASPSKNDAHINQQASPNKKAAADGSSEEKNDELPKWKRTCTNVSYIQSEFTNDICPSGLFKVQFTYEFQKGQQEVYFAHSVPYTYSMLQDYLQKQKVKK